ncbi:PREDICTED: uncharacterized protein LOC109186445 [Ipomoea nil]|uniref:uncharacterized protein LOC109186445 n=1 Tax=Ipomoea nil TaxID=35883 RepID=UPI000901E34E|nr:PREDICTED: uncharacterized protein LOC109186445 [Ipomoea nil]
MAFLASFSVLSFAVKKGLMQIVFLGWIVLLSALARNVNCLKVSSLPGNLSGVSDMAVETAFQFPSALPQWPPGTGFGAGAIDLGGLIVAEVSNFTKIWAAQEGGPDGIGAAIFEPTAVPDGFYMLGHYVQPNNVRLFGWVLVGKDVTNGSSGAGALASPVDYTLVWSSENTGIQQDSAAYIWLPVPADGYKPVGQIVTTSPEKPPLDKIRCVRVDFTDVSENDDWIWGSNDLNIYLSRPKDRGIQASGVNAGTFIAQLSNNNETSSSSVACLKNVNPKNTSAMPNLSQIEALIQTYSPRIYFHPDDEFLPSSVTWFFQNGALLYTKGQESSPVAVQPGGENLPQGGDNDGAYWLDLPLTDPDRVKQGNLQNSICYIHVKPMLGATFTDLVVWVFYPFNGPARAKLVFLTLKLGKIGEHVGDWEHVTLRISNFNGELKRVYFSEHSKGRWLSAAAVELQDGNKPVVYSSLHGHATYSSPGLVLQGGKDIGIRDDMEKGDVYMDTAASFSVVSAEYLGSVVVESPWLNFAREWGPKTTYDLEKELEKVERFLPEKLKEELEKIIKNIPSEVLGEEGPTGPKGKDNWSGDEYY